MNGSIDSLGHLIGEHWVSGHGPSFESHNPFDSTRLWCGHVAGIAEVNQAIGAARAAFTNWAGLDPEKREDFLAAFVALLEKHRPKLAESISSETGKPLWESLAEVSAMKAKLTISLKAQAARCRDVSQPLADNLGWTRFRPHGVVAVFGPFNMPGHLPNGHIMPALLAGNTVIFKPSELTPMTGELIAALWREAGIPPGVFNMLQGDHRTGQALSEHPNLDGLFFTGSFKTGMMLQNIGIKFPHRITALEMGGNNPLVIWDVADIKSAALTTILSAFITAGQRCSCARRLIVPGGPAGDTILDAIINAASTIRIGCHTLKPEPFMGPVINLAAAQKVLAAQENFLSHGGQTILPLRPLPESPALLTPGIIDVTSVMDRRDEEIFGPLLQVIRVADFDTALMEANNTRYGLSAAILSDRPGLYAQFRVRIRAGVINWNHPTTGASSELPFGGIGHSGNHRPCGYYSSDYCAYPIACMETPHLHISSLPPGINQ